MIPDSLPMLAGQAIMAGFPGHEPPDELLEAAARGELGGFILFRRNLDTPAQVAALCARLRDAFPADLPPFLGVDQEGGRVSRLAAPIVQLPAARALAAIGQPQLTAEAGELLGRQLTLLGFNIDFAPVLDVDTNPDNPVIGDRSFGRDAKTVIEHARAFAQGLARGGQIACGKHFPGHGDTEIDSHLALPRLSHPRSRLDAVELAPFRALAAELPCIMTAHVVFDAIDGARPATLSSAAITGLLRETLGFEGVVFSDDLEMKAIADHHGVPNAVCATIAAGSDVALVCSRPDWTLAAHEALVQRAEADPALRARLKNAAERSLKLRRAAAKGAAPPSPSAVQEALQALEPLRMQERIANATPRAPVTDS